jgi:hypothetical protein
VQIYSPVQNLQMSKWVHTTKFAHMYVNLLMCKIRWGMQIVSYEWGLSVKIECINSIWHLFTGSIFMLRRWVLDIPPPPKKKGEGVNQWLDVALLGILVFRFVGWDLYKYMHIADERTIIRYTIGAWPVNLSVLYKYCAYFKTFIWYDLQ